MAYTLIQSEDRGDTLYVGSRTSDQLGRLYDKERESKDPAYRGCWRWEVQYRRAHALSAVRALSATQEAAPAITATVASWFRARNVGATYRVDVDPLPVGVDRKAPDDVRWLDWARRCVRPRAQEMAKRYGWRFVAETLLGRIATYEEWETLVGAIEIELVEDN